MSSFKKGIIVEQLWEKALRILEYELNVKFDDRMRRVYKCLFMKYSIYENLNNKIVDKLVKIITKRPLSENGFFQKDDDIFKSIHSLGFTDDIIFEGLMLTGATPINQCSNLGINLNEYSSCCIDGAGSLTNEIREIIKSSSSDNKLITPQTFLKSLFDLSIKEFDSEDRPHTITALNELLIGLKYPYVIKEDSTYKVIEKFLNEISEYPSTQDEQCFLMFLGKENIRIRPISFLNNYNLDLDKSGLYIPITSHLTHFLDRFSFITGEEIEELEFLINKQNVAESELQHFFELHPNFLLGRQYKRLHSQVILTREDQGSLIPDFMIEGPQGEINKIVDLKKPNQRFVRSKKNRHGFLQSLIEARDQLLEYRNYFEDRSYRKIFEMKTGLKAFRPQISVIIGRSNEYQNFYQKQTIKSHEQNLEIITYDEILSSARSRLIDFENGWNNIKDNF